MVQRQRVQFPGSDDALATTLMTPPPPTLAARRSRHVPIAVWKGLASVVIVVCLAAQTYAAVRPSGVRFYPFIDYPMYAHSRHSGETFHLRELWARTCGARPRAWKVEARTLGFQDSHYLIGLNSARGERPFARRYRARLSELARTHLEPRPCVLQLWERAVPTTRDGVDVSAIRHPKRTLLVEWSVDLPGTTGAASTR